MQQADDCDLRPATLRGLLRWWWRTMHAGFVDTETLRRMESLLWGDTNGGSLIQISMSPDKNRAPSPFEYRGYLSYGVARERVVRSAGSSWRLRMVARRGRRLEGLTPEIVRDQAVTPLWLLCNYGGVGSKGRKGYGSLEMSPSPADWSRDKVENTAQEFRDWLEQGRSSVPRPGAVRRHRNRRARIFLSKDLDRVLRMAPNCSGHPLAARNHRGIVPMGDKVARETRAGNPRPAPQGPKRSRGSSGFPRSPPCRQRGRGLVARACRGFSIGYPRDH